jgi:hypothetical protein
MVRSRASLPGGNVVSIIGGVKASEQEAGSEEEDIPEEEPAPDIQVEREVKGGNQSGRNANFKWPPAAVR